MKLYSTITSERATKGQGGTYLIIRIYKEDNSLYGCLLKTDVDGIMGFIACDNEKMRIKAVNPLKVLSFSNSLEKEKGERQKGETHYGQHIDESGNAYCLKCRKFEK
jgi:hypothetical protein